MLTTTSSPLQKFPNSETSAAKQVANTKFTKTKTVIPASTQEVKKQETSKLPITGDSIALFVILAALIIMAIFVYVRMKKANKKADK